MLPDDEMKAVIPTPLFPAFLTSNQPQPTYKPKSARQNVAEVCAGLAELKAKVDAGTLAIPDSLRAQAAAAIDPNPLAWASGPIQQTAAWMLDILEGRQPVPVLNDFSDIVFADEACRDEPRRCDPPRSCDK